MADEQVSAIAARAALRAAKQAAKDTTKAKASVDSKVKRQSSGSTRKSRTK